MTAEHPAPFATSPLRIMILFRRNVVAAEVDALVAHLVAERGHALTIACSMRSLTALLSEDTSRAAAFVDLAGRPMEPLRPKKSAGGGAEEATRAVRVATVLRKALLGLGPSRALLLARSIARRAREVRSLLARHRPNALLVFDDRAVVPEMLCLREAKARGIPAVLVPFAASSVESDLLLRAAKPDHHVEAGLLRPLKRRLARRYPAHALHRPEGPVLFFDMWSMLPMAAFGLLHTRPWSIGGGDVDAVGVLGPADRRQVLEQGVEPDRVHVTGQPSLDALARARGAGRAALRQALHARYGIDPATPLAVCALPQYAEHGMLDAERHAAVTQALFRAMGASGAAGLLSLHPKSKPDAYRPAADRHGLVIAAEPLRDLLPAADVFVATYSSTVRWSVMLGIPTVIADLPRLRYTLFADLKEVRVVEEEDALAAELAALASDAAGREALGAALSRRGVSLGVLDGLACRRLSTLVETLVGAPEGGVKPGASRSASSA